MPVISYGQYFKFKDYVNCLCDITYQDQILDIPVQPGRILLQTDFPSCLKSRTYITRNVSIVHRRPQLKAFQLKMYISRS